MRLDVGPVAPASAVVWIEWTRQVVQQLRSEPASAMSLPRPMLDYIDSYLDAWEGSAPTGDDPFRWHADVDPEELEYLTNAIYTLEVWLSTREGQGAGVVGPTEGRGFYLALVRALLHTLESESRTRAAFVDQLRSSWHSSAQAE